MTAAAARRLFVPEVIQSSAMDCGPASLKSMLEGFGIPVGYGRLREACSTDVDGTSIDTLEDVALELGLEAEQTMVPLDHLLLGEAETMPAIVVVQLPHSGMHFIVVWRKHGRLVQVMDPGVGRRWVTAEALLREVYRHEMVVDAAAWRDFAGSEGFSRPLLRRMQDIGIAAGRAREMFEAAIGDPGWRRVAVLDAAVRMSSRLTASGAVSGSEAARLVEQLASAPPATIPDRYWSVLAADPADDGAEQVRLRGAVLVRVVGRAAPGQHETRAAGALDPALLASLRGREETSWAPLFTALRQSGAPLGLLTLGALGIAGATALIQALLLRGALDLGHWLGIAQHRLSAALVLMLFLGLVLLLELPMTLALAQIGRKLDVSLRVAFQRKIPKTADNYLRSRLLSDMAERLHAAPVLRTLPGLFAGWMRGVFLLAFTVAGLLWLAPWLAGWVIATTVLATALSLASATLIQEREMRFRSHGATLVRFYLDALQGVASIRAHGAGRALMREQEGIMVQWSDAGRRLQLLAVAIEAVQAASGFILAIGLVATHLGREGTTGSLLLVTYWALQLPVLAQYLAVTARQIPPIRNTLIRLLEPLGAPEETVESDAEVVAPPVPEPAQIAPRAEAVARQTNAITAVRPHREGVHVELAGVDVRAGGHTVLADVTLDIAPGSQIGIVGESGAGKSTLLGLLLGWHRPAAGAIRLDGRTLTARDLAFWRRRTAWVDPAVQLFNRPLVQNLVYGSERGATDIARAIEDADLRAVLERLPEGMQTLLGEGGALVSGGEGQRVRLARAWLRTDVNLVLLDEPFRGLDREKRRVLLERARAHWAGATMICVTHDVADTLVFNRVLVVEGGQIVEDGDPRALALDMGSRYSAMLANEQFVRERLWASPDWRHVRVEDGQIIEQSEGDWLDLPRLIEGDSQEHGA